MKYILLFLLLAGVTFAAEESLQPRKALETLGSFTISDGASYYKFTKDGKFHSGPMGISGRELDGRWTTADFGRFTVIAKMSWMNGIQPQDEFRRIVFLIYHVRKQVLKEGEIRFSQEDLFDSYYLIDEFVKIPKPDTVE